MENWGGGEFGAYVSFLEETFDELAAGAGEAEQARMAGLFKTTLRCEAAFWELADTDWRGLGA